MNWLQKKETALLIGYARREEIQALFELFGMVAVAGSPASEKQMREIERFIQYQVPRDEQRFAMESFKTGTGLTLLKGMVTGRAFALYGIHSEPWLEPVQILDMLTRVALADGELSRDEEYIIDSARATLGVHSRSYWILRDTLAERLRVSIRRSGSSFAHAEDEFSKDRSSSGAGAGPSPHKDALSREAALATLGLQDGADAALIKSTHRVLVKKFHPDLATGANATEAAAREAVRKFYEIQQAYEFLLSIG